MCVLFNRCLAPPLNLGYTGEFWLIKEELVVCNFISQRQSLRPTTTSLGVTTFLPARIEYSYIILRIESSTAFQQLQQFQLQQFQQLQQFSALSPSSIPQKSTKRWYHCKLICFNTTLHYNRVAYIASLSHFKISYYAHVY